MKEPVFKLCFPSEEILLIKEADTGYKKNVLSLRLVVFFLITRFLQKKFLQ